MAIRAIRDIMGAFIYVYVYTVTNSNPNSDSPDNPDNPFVTSNPSDV